LIRFINPNYHVILIHYPLALLGVGLLIELLTVARSEGSLRSAGRWMILIGALAAIPAATSGIFAKYDVVQQSAGGQEDVWANLKASSKLSALQWKMLNNHVLWASIGTGTAVLTVMGWLSLCDGRRKRIYPLALVVLLWSMAVMGVGAFHAGEMVYRTGVATHSEDESQAMESDWQKQLAADKPREKVAQRIEYYVGPLQVHVIVAGLAFAVAAGALGASLGKRVPKESAEGEEKEKAPAKGAPVSRIWLVASVMGLATVGVGWYVISSDLTTPLLDVKGTFLSQIWQPYRSDPANNRRMLAHLVLGAGIVVLPLILAIAARLAARRRILIGIMGLILIAVVAGQIWLGILMMYDTDSGPLTHFNPATPPSDSGAQQASIDK
jgi:uncharacterized membrane protein